MIVERALADADLGGDGVDANRADALQIEQAVRGFQNPLFHGRFRRGERHCTDLCSFHLTAMLLAYVNYTDLCNQARVRPTAARRLQPGRRQQENKNNEHVASAHPANPASRASHPDRRVADAQSQHGIAAEPRHLPATADPRRRHFGVGFHPRHCRAEPGLGLSAAVRRRADGAARLSPDHDGRRGALYRGTRADGECAWLRQHPDRRRRADRDVAGVYRVGDRDVGRHACGAHDGAQHRAGHHLGCGIARLAAGGAARPDPESGLRLADRPARVRGVVAGAASGRLVCRPGRQDSAAETGRRRDRQHLGAGRGGQGVRQCIVRGDDLRLLRLRHASGFAPVSYTHLDVYKRQP